MTRLSPGALRILALLLVLVLVAAFFATQIDNYLNARLFNRISSSVAIVALIATGQTLVILTRNIDLSLGSVVGFVAYATGAIVSAAPEIHPVLLALAALAIGAGFGLLNGLLVAYAGIPSIITTLAAMAIYRSALVEFSGAQSITTEDLPQWLVDFPNTQLFTLAGVQFRAAFVAAVVIVILVHLALLRLRPARALYAVGSNPEAAEMAGIDARRTVLAAFVAAGALAGLAGLFFLARFGNITVVAGLGFELKSIAAAVLGGVSINGGSGSVIGALIGAVLVDLIENSLVRWELVSEFWREAVLGFLILSAVSADALLMRRLTRLRIRREKAAPAPTPKEATS
ncbi:ABC transporter permease [Rubellimicrobium arenae]|uniref:ABC transporter permease n=1 Tax=Rubellimicrobium arenae TaxID=2817372 RepID=UPI001B30313C|nr:ABC transporter permease [Rubellimicrobium arenae]